MRQLWVRPIEWLILVMKFCKLRDTLGALFYISLKIPFFVNSADDAVVWCSGSQAVPGMNLAVY